MSALQDDDGQTRFALGLVSIIVALVVTTVIGFAVSRSGMRAVAVAPAGAVGAAAAGMASGAASLPDAAGIRVAQGVVRFYYASGSSDLPAGAAESLAPIIEGVGAGKKAQISGFHDRTGDAAVNEALARRRAEGVRDLLASLGAPAAQVTMEKPQSTEGTGNNAQARRVEVKLVD